MEDKITTSKLEDLLLIFDPKAQEQEDAGGARILYTFDDSETPERHRVGDAFILAVEEHDLNFFVSAPINENITEGSIIFSQSIEGLHTTYSIAEIETLVSDALVALGIGNDDDVSSLLEK